MLETIHPAQVLTTRQQGHFLILEAGERRPDKARLSRFQG